MEAKFKIILNCLKCSKKLKHMNRNYYICSCELIHKIDNGKLVEYHQLGVDHADDVCIVDEIMNCKGTD